LLLKCVVSFSILYDPSTKNALLKLVIYIFLYESAKALN